MISKPNLGRKFLNFITILLTAFVATTGLVSSARADAGFHHFKVTKPEAVYAAKKSNRGEIITPEEAEWGIETVDADNNLVSINKDEIVRIFSSQPKELSLRIINGRGNLKLDIENTEPFLIEISDPDNNKVVVQIPVEVKRRLK